MLDKDIDKLFQDRFSDFETPPSNLMWDKIADKLEDKKPVRKVNPTVWQLAASVLIVVSGALWFYRPHEVIKLHGKDAESVTVANNTDPVVKEVASRKDEEEILKDSLTPEKIKESEKVPYDHTEDFLAAQNLESLPHATVSQTTDTEFIEPVKIETIYGAAPESAPVVAMSTKLDFAEAQLVESESPKVKIRSIGSLVNFVIAKVDHRENKIIEFKDSDEGSEVSGINLGVLKFKSRNKQ